jgi:hypothetical protein
VPAVQRISQELDDVDAVGHSLAAKAIEAPHAVDSVHLAWFPRLLHLLFAVTLL